MSFEPRVLARDRRTGKLVLFHELPDGRFAIESTMDVEPIFEANKVRQSAARSDWKGDSHHVAGIDMRVWQQLRQEGRMQEQKDFSKWLNDPDNSKWRSKRGRV